MSPYIQTQVSLDAHRRLEAIAKRRGTSLKEIVGEAIDDYLRYDDPADEDPIWNLVGTVDLPAGNWSERKNWRFPELD